MLVYIQQMMQQMMADPAMAKKVTSQLQSAIAAAAGGSSGAGLSSSAARPFKQPPLAQTQSQAQTHESQLSAIYTSLQQPGGDAAQQSQLSAIYKLLQQPGIQTPKPTLGQLGHQLNASMGQSMGQSSALMLAGGTSSPSHSNAALLHHTHGPVPTMANIASRPTAAYSQTLAGAGPASGSGAANAAANIMNQIQSNVQDLRQTAFPNSSGALRQGPNGSYFSIPQMDGAFEDMHHLQHDDLHAQGCLPQLDGADEDLDGTSLVPPVPGDLDRDLDLDPGQDLDDGTKAAHVHVEVDEREPSPGGAFQPERAWISDFASTQQQGGAESVLGFDSPQSVAQGSSIGKDGDVVRRDKRVSKPKEQKDFSAEPQLKKSRSADEKMPYKAAVSSETHQEHMRLLIQHAAQRADTQQVSISNQVIRLPQLLAAIRAKGMENGIVVWLHVASLLKINVKSCHTYSIKLMQLLEGNIPDDGQDCRIRKLSKNRSSADKSKGMLKRPGMTGMVMPISKKPKAPPMLIQRMTQSQARELDKDQCTIQQDSHTTFVTLKLLTGVTLKDREDYTHVLPMRHKMKPRQGGIIAAHAGVRKAAQMAHRLWVQSIFDSVARCDALQERLKRQKVAKLTNVEGWDLSRLGRFVEAAAVGQGLLYWADSKLCSANLKAHHIAELGVLSDDREKLIRRSLGQVHREINRDPRMCCLCRIVGDLGVQGRLLYVETNSWAHVSCLCWSKGVYETTIQRNIGKIGMLCNVHDLLQSARECLCDFCGCPGATVVCSAPGCCSQSHFGCAVLKNWSFYSESRVFCDLCTECPAAEACGGVSNAWAAIHLYRLTSRHLRVMPRNKPKLLESPLVREERAKKSSALSKKRKSPLVDSAQLTQEEQRGVNRTEMARENADSVAAHSKVSGGGSTANTVGGGEETTFVWTAHVDRNTKRTYYHNHLTKESVWTKPQELTTALRSVTCTTSASENSHVSDSTVDSLGTPARGGAAGDSGAAGAAMAASGATEGKDPISRLRRAIENGQLDPVSSKRLQALFVLLGNCEKTKCVVLRTAIVPEENCFLGFASLVVNDEAAFSVQLQHLVQANEGGIWTTCPVGEDVEAHLRAESIMTHLLRTIHVFPGVSSSKSWNFDKEKDVEHVAHAAAAHVHSATSETHGKAPFEQLADLAIVGSMTDAAQATQAVPHSAVSAGGSIEGGIQHAVTAARASHHPTPHAQHARQEQSQVQQAQQVEQSSAAQPGARAMTSIASIAAKNRAEKSARAAEQVALEAVQREREEALNREQWDAYENNLLSNVANGMQSGTVMARIGSLTVRRLGKIKVDDDSYHSELAIYPVGYMSNRVCFAPGEIQSKTGVACRRAVYKCQILMGLTGGAPLFKVSVENQDFHGTSASQAWELATRRPLRSLAVRCILYTPEGILNRALYDLI